MQAAPKKLLTSLRPPVAVRDPTKPLNIQPSSRAIEVPKAAFAPSAPRKTAGRKRRGRKGKALKTRRRHRK